MNKDTFKDTATTAGLSLKAKLIIISVVAVLGLAAVYLPKWMPNLLGQKPAITTFQPTPKAQEAYNRALKGDKPIYLEFYAKW